jgi:hypothetical protein
VVRLLEPVGRVLALPVIRPEASRVTELTLPSDWVRRSMVWRIRPDESRTTSRQVWASNAEARANETQTANHRIFIFNWMVFRGDSFKKSVELQSAEASG